MPDSNDLWGVENLGHKFMDLGNKTLHLIWLVGFRFVRVAIAEKVRYQNTKASLG